VHHDNFHLCFDEQGKLAQARSNNGAVSFPATQAASKKAFATPVNTRSRQFMNNSESGWGNAPSWRHNRQKLANTFAAAAGNMKIVVVNNSSKNGAGRPAGTLRRKAMTGPKQQVATVTQKSNLVHLFALSLSCTVQTLHLSIVCIPYNGIH
jgi:hypothetical protein